MGQLARLANTLLGPRLTQSVIQFKDQSRRSFRAWTLRGDKVYCPCCEGTFRDFANANAVYQRRGECPRCGARERHRRMMLYLRRKTALLEKGGRLLHVAPEPTFMKAFSQHPQIEYVSIDLMSPLATYRMDLTNLTFEDESFDFVICSHVLEHVPEDRKAMSEIFRVMRKGATAILMVPLNYSAETTDEDPSVTDPAERLRRFGQIDHVRVYGRDYFERLKGTGFQVELDKFAEELDPVEMDRCGLFRNDPVVACRKPSA